jgi:hypothetical protein
VALHVPRLTVVDQELVEDDDLVERGVLAIQG